MKAEFTDLNDILNFLETTSLEPHDDYTSEFSYKDQKVLWKYIKVLTEKNQELKKQLEKYETTNKVLSQELTKDKMLQQDYLTTCCGILIGDIPKLINQQKEFIKYLEEYIEKLSPPSSYNNVDEKVVLTNVLIRYKEILGVSDEHKTKI